MTPTTVSRYTDAWHAAQEADERAWLDQWARLHLIPVTHQPEPAPAPALATAGRP
jgi:hypothetical protein